MISNDVMFGVVLPKCGLRELLALCCVSRRLNEVATAEIRKSVSVEDICKNCSPEFIMKFSAEKKIKAKYVIKHRLGHIEPQLIEYIIDELNERAAILIIRGQKLAPKHLRLFIERCRYRFSSHLMNTINFNQHITPEQLFEFSELMEYTTIYAQKHLHDHLHRLRKTSPLCESLTDWRLISPPFSEFMTFALSPAIIMFITIAVKKILFFLFF